MSIQSSFLPLPEEVSLHILSYLDLKQLKASSYICKEANRLTSDPMLWKALFHKMFNNKPLPKGMSYPFACSALVPIKHFQELNRVMTVFLCTLKKDVTRRLECTFAGLPQLILEQRFHSAPPSHKLLQFRPCQKRQISNKEAAYGALYQNPVTCWEFALYKENQRQPPHTKPESRLYKTVETKRYFFTGEYRQESSISTIKTFKKYVFGNYSCSTCLTIPNAVTKGFYHSLGNKQSQVIWINVPVDIGDDHTLYYYTALNDYETPFPLFQILASQWSGLIPDNSDFKFVKINSAGITTWESQEGMRRLRQIEYWSTMLEHYLPVYFQNNPVVFKS